MPRQLTGRLPWQRADGKWEYTLVKAARKKAGFETMETYIRRRQNVVACYIATQSLLDICEAMKSKQGAWMGMQWW